MKTTKTIVTTTCDLCTRQIVSNGDYPDLVIGDKTCHICSDCLRRVELYADRVLRGVVPDKRGGTRQLGSYDG